MKNGQDNIDDPHYAVMRKVSALHPFVMKNSHGEIDFVVVQRGATVVVSGPNPCFGTLDNADLLRQVYRALCVLSRTWDWLQCKSLVGAYNDVDGCSNESEFLTVWGERNGVVTCLEHHRV